MRKDKFITLKEACNWATSYLGRQVTESNISYLIQYGKIHKYDEKGNLKTTSNGVTKVSLYELKRYYDSCRKEKIWKKKLGEDINWNLSFDNFKESDRTKHVHRLHPYKGKFIPQLVEYFLDDHTDDFKKTVFFHKGDIILDPFVGSGTTLVQCLELGLHSIGIDISQFNCIISEVKTQKYDLDKLSKELRIAAKATEEFSKTKFRYESEDDIDRLLASFNNKYYPSPEFKILINFMREYQNKIQSEANAISKGALADREKIVEIAINKHKNETFMLEKKVQNFLKRNFVPMEFKIDCRNVENLVNDFTSKYERITLKELDEKIRRIKRKKQAKLVDENEEPFAGLPFLSTWFTKRHRLEMQYYLDQIKKQKNPKIQNVMKIILSRTARSCRCTTHVDLATLVKPQYEPYYCRKHFKICRPIPTIIRHLRRYTEDTIKRIREFSRLRKDVFCEVINDDSRTVDIFDSIAKKNYDFYKLLKKKRIDGIFTSPPYVGQIDYHEQHAYSYELFDIKRKDKLEIGKKSNGTGKKAQREYIAGISSVLLNVKKYLKRDSHIFIVANDNKNLYPKIAKASDLEIVEIFRRPVLNRTERDKQPYSEFIFHMIPK